jgi:hypothetical protein
LPESRRTIVVERKAIHDVLHVVLGTSRMKCSIGFQNPAGLGGLPDR